MANKIVTILDLDDRGFKGALGRIKADVASAETSFGKLRAGAKGVATEFKKSNEAQAAVLAGVGAAAFKAIQLGSDLAESINAVKVVYGDTADAVLALGENSAKSFGLSKTELNALAVQFSAFAKNVAQAEGREVSDVLAEMTGRIADFASVMNLEVNDAAQVFMSTMAGETEPIRRFGKDVSAAAVELYALENGLIDNKKELTESIKVQARYGLLMESTADTAGDFANTSDELANSQRILTADLKDMAAELGQDLAPALQTVVMGMQSLVDAADALGVTDVIGFFGELDRVSYQAGVNLRMFFDSTAWENWTITNAINEAEVAARTFDKSLLDGLTTFDEVRDKVLETTGSYHAANLVVVEWSKAQEDLTGSTDDLTEAQDEQKTSTKELRDHYADMADEFVAGQEASEEAAREHTAALQAQADAADELIGKKTALVGGDIAVRDAQRRARDAAIELTTELANQDRTMDSVAEATDGAAGAYLRAADAAVDFAADQLEANGTAVTAEDRSRMLKDELARLAAGVDGPLRQALQRYIDDLNRIPAEKNTTVTTTVKTVGGGGGSSLVRAADTGGVVPGAVGSPQMILAHGGEKILPMHRSDAAARATIEAAMGGGGGGRGGGVVINVTAGMGTDGRQVGRQIVDALREFKRAGGNVSI